MSGVLNKESLRARLDEYKLVTDRSKFGSFLFNLMYGINKGELVKKVDLSPDAVKPDIFRYFAFRPALFPIGSFADSGEVTIRNGIIPGSRCVNSREAMLNRIVEIVYFDGFLNDPFGPQDATIATVDHSLVPRTPLGDVRERTVLDQLIVITNGVISTTSTAAVYMPDFPRVLTQPLNANY